MSLKDLIEADVAAVFFNKEDFAESATFRQGPGEAIPIDAIFHDVKYEIEGAEGFNTSFAGTDVSIPVAQLGSVVPRPGAEITRANGWVYEVQPVGDDEPAWRIDATGHVMTIHTKKTR